MLGSILAARFGYKGVVIISFMLPCVLGAGLLYGLGRTANFQGGLLFGYYCIGFLFGCNPLIYAWVAANNGGMSIPSSASPNTECCPKGIPRNPSPSLWSMPVLQWATSSGRSCSARTRRQSTIRVLPRCLESSLRAAFFAGSSFPCLPSP